MTKVLLSSGGMDSFFVATMVPDLLHVYVDIGHKYNVKEYTSAKRMAAYFTTELRTMIGAQIGQYEHESGIIPMRNAELLLCAAQHGERLYMGVLHGEVNSDKSPEFMEAMASVMNISHRAQYWTEGKQFSIHTPLRGYTKAELVRDYWINKCNENGNTEEWEALLDTVSCYDGGDHHCGACPSCFKRWVALTVGTGRDFADVHFAKHPADWYPVAYWEGKGYEQGRMVEIRKAYELRR